jgi:GT2 family glycosyltransferase
MQVSVVILNWNGEKFLKQFLPVLLEKTHLSYVEILVVDNGSTDGSLQLLKEQFPTVRTILFDKNYGFAEGYNKALSEIKSDYYVLLNSDVEVTDNWLLPLVDYMEKHPQTAACQPKILSYFKRTHFEHAGAAGGFIDYLGFAFCRGRIFGEVEEDKGQYDEPMNVFWTSGACMMVRAASFHKMGGFDPDFFAHMEEIDLCWRFNSRGYQLACIPESVVYHIGGGTLHSEHPFKTYLNFRNNLLMLYKNLPKKQLKGVFFKRAILDYMAVFQFLISAKPKNAQSILKARSDFRKMKPNFLEKRKENILYSTATSFPMIYTRSIVVDYYLRRKKKFSQLKFTSKEN